MTDHVHLSREAWLSARRTGIGASEVSAILGHDERYGPLAIYAAKVGEAPDRVSIEMEMGRRFEAPVCDWYADESGRTIEDPGPWTITRGRHPRVFASLDRRAFDDERGPGCVEAKLIWPGKAVHWKGGPPLTPLIQLQTQLAVAGLAWGSIAVCVGGMRCYYWDVERSDDFIAEMYEAADRFWACVERREIPPADGFPETARALTRLFPAIEPPVTTMLEGDHWVDVANRLQAKRDQRKALETEERALSNEIRRGLKTATVGYLSDGTRVKWQRDGDSGGRITRLSRARAFRGRRA